VLVDVLIKTQYC